MTAFSREAFIMAGVQTEELRSALFEEAKAVFASGGTYRDWADTFSMHGFEPDNPFHLRTNYDTAANAAYSAGQWEQINENKDIFPYLRYVTMQDDKVREEHWALHNLIYPVDDPFWDNYMPPNGRNCRCSVEQLMQSELPKDYSPMGPDSPVIVDPKFMNNPGKANTLLYLESLNAKQIPWDEAGFPPMKGHPIETPPHLNQVSGLSEEQLSDLYAKSLASRTVFDVNHVPLVIDVEKADKLGGYPLKSFRSRVKYIASLDDVLKHPHEVWLQPDNHNRVFYIKRYEKDIVVIAEIEEDGVFRYFDIMTSSNVTATVRSGVPLYLKR